MINYQHIKYLNLDEILPEEEKVKFLSDLEIITDNNEDFSIRVLTSQTKIKKFTKLKSQKLKTFLENKI